jgi:hypothetical protein
MSIPKSRATQNATQWQVRAGEDGVADEICGAGKAELCWSIGGAFSCRKICLQLI